MPLTFYQPILHGADRLHMALLPPRRRPSRPLRTAIGTCNIRDGRVFGLAQAIQEVERGGFDLMLLTETNIQTETKI